MEVMLPCLGVKQIFQVVKEEDFEGNKVLCFQSGQEATV